MGHIDNRGGLAIAELVFYAPAALLAIAVYAKQGLLNFGWFYLNVVCALRIVGASVTIYIETHSNASTGLIETATITSAIGLTPLLLCLGGIVHRIHRKLEERGYSAFLFHAIHLTAITAVVLAIFGGVDSVNITANDYATGRKCAKAGSIVFLLAYLGLAVITILTATQKRSFIPSSENKLMIAAVCVLPFLLVRIIYTIASAFSSPGSVFYFVTPNVWVEGFMMFAMEAITVLFYIWAGLLSPKRTAAPATYDHNVEAYGKRTGSGDVPYVRETETTRN